MAFARFCAPDLPQMRTFLEHFGMIDAAPVDAVAGRLWMRGAGPAPFLHETVEGPVGFGGVGLRASSFSDLATLAAAEDVEVAPLDRPGGGYGIVLSDPDGIRVEVVAGQKMGETSQLKPRDPWNDASRRARARTARSSVAGAATVVRLGHCVLRVSNLRRSEAWWKERFGFITSDEVVDAGDAPVAIFMRCDRGGELTDHHTITLAQAGPDEDAGFHHAAFEVLDLDDVMSGHDHLLHEGYEPVWGIGRHVLGSQIFDYWLDPFGNRVEHWTDGDLFTAEDGSKVVGLDVMFSNHWGPAPKPSFLNTRASA